MRGGQGATQEVEKRGQNHWGCRAHAKINSVFQGDGAPPDLIASLMEPPAAGWSGCQGGVVAYRCRKTSQRLHGIAGQRFPCRPGLCGDEGCWDAREADIN